MLWVRAVWKEECQEEEAVIPASWVMDGVVHWPMLSNVDKAMKQGRRPGDGKCKWSTFPLLKEKIRSENRRECEDHDLTTALETDEDEDENPRNIKRQRTKTRYPDFVVGQAEASGSNEPGDEPGDEATNMDPQPRNDIHFPPAPEKFQRRHSPSPSPPPVNTQVRIQSPSPPPVNRLIRIQSPSPPPVNTQVRIQSPSPPPVNTQVRIQSPSPPLVNRRIRSRSPLRREASPCGCGALIRERSSPVQASMVNRRRRIQSPSPPPVNTQVRIQSPSPPPVNTQVRIQSPSPPLVNRRIRSRSPLRREGSPCGWGAVIRERSSPVLASMVNRRRRIQSPSPPPVNTQFRIQSPSPPPVNTQVRIQSPSPPLVNRSRSPLRREGSPCSWGSVIRERSSHVLPSMNTPRGRQTTIHSHSAKSSRELSTEVRVNDKARHPEDQTTAAYPMSDSKFQKKVIYLLTDIRDQVKQLGNPQGRSTGPSLLPTKANSIDELMKIEATLKSLETKERMIAGLSKIGGTNNRDTAKNILERLMATDVMSKFNMKGKKGKFAFRKLRIHQVIIESMLKEGVTEFDIDQDVAYCLKYAPDRRGGGGRNKEQDTPN